MAKYNYSSGDFDSLNQEAKIIKEAFFSKEYLLWPILWLYKRSVFIFSRRRLSALPWSYRFHASDTSFRWYAIRCSD